jgi:hypothetical protein
LGGQQEREYDLLLVSGRVLYLRSSAVRFESLTPFRPLLFPGNIEALYIFSSFHIISHLFLTTTRLAFGRQSVRGYLSLALVFGELPSL